MSSPNIPSSSSSSSGITWGALYRTFVTFANQTSTLASYVASYVTNALTGGSLRSKFNTLDDGLTGAMTIAGNVQMGGSLTSTKNILDDGSGNMTVGGNIIVDGYLSAGAGTIDANVPVTIYNKWSGGGVTASVLFNTGFYGNVGSFGWNNGNGSFITNYGGDVILGQGNSGSAHNKALLSANNTLDDGSGNMLVLGTVTFRTANTGMYFDTSGNAVFQSGAATTASWNVIGNSTGGGQPSLAVYNNTSDGQVLICQGTNTFRCCTQPFSTVTFNVTHPGVVTTTKNTLDDSNGNAVINSTNSSSTAFRVQNNGTNILTCNASTNAINTKNNTLDDGSGKMTVAGNIIGGGSIISKYNTFDDGFGNGGVNSQNNATVAFGVLTNGVTILKCNGLTKAVITNNNTLDDGSGNIITSGNIYFGGISTSGLQMDNLGNLIFQTGATSTSIWSITNSAKTSALFEVWNSGYATMSLGNTLAQAFHVNDSSGNSLLNINATSKALTTFNNTLDDGNGNATINSKNASTSAFQIQNNGTNILSCNASTNAITTKNSTLDDGSGNVVIGGVTSVTQTSLTNSVISNSTKTIITLPAAGSWTSSSNTQFTFTNSLITTNSIIIPTLWSLGGITSSTQGLQISVQTASATSGSCHIGVYNSNASSISSTNFKICVLVL